MSYTDRRDQRLRRAPQGGGGHRGLFGQATHLLSQAGPGIAHLAQSAWRTATAAERFRQGQPSRGQTRPYNLRDLGDVASYGALTEGGGAFERVLPLPAEFTTSLHNTQSRLTNPTQYYRAAIDKEGYPDLLPMLVEDIGNAAIVAAPASMALGRGAAIAGAAGRTGAAARLGGAARVAARTAAVGGEIADLGLPRLGGAGLRKAFPASAEMIAEAASRGREPSVFAPAVEAAGRAIRRPFQPGVAPGTWRYNMGKRFPTLLTNEGRAALHDVILPAARESNVAGIQVTEPLKRAAAAPTLEDIPYTEPRVPRLPPEYPQTIIDPRNPPPRGGGQLVGPDGSPIGPMGPAAERAAARRAAAMPAGYGPAFDRRAARLAGEEPVTGLGGRRQVTVPRPREGYDPGPLVGEGGNVTARGLRDQNPDIWQLGPDGTLHLVPQWQDQYAGTGRGAVSMGETYGKSANYAFEKVLGSGAAFDNLDQGVMAAIDTARLGVPFDKSPGHTGMARSLPPDEAALIRTMNEETTYISPEGQVRTRNASLDDPAAQQRTTELRDAITDLSRELPGWQQMDSRELYRPVVDLQEPFGPLTREASRALQSVLGSSPNGIADLIDVAEGRKAYARHRNGTIEIYDVADLTRKPEPLVVPKGAWRTLNEQEITNVIGPKLRSQPLLDPADLPMVENEVISEIRDRAQAGLDALQAGMTREQIQQAIWPEGNTGYLRDKVSNVQQTWTTIGDSQPHAGGRGGVEQRVRGSEVDRLWRRLNNPNLIEQPDWGDYGKATPLPEVEVQLEMAIEDADTLLNTELPPTEIAPLELGTHGLHGLGGFNRARPLPEPGTVTSQRAAYVAPRTGGGRVEPTVTRITPRPPPPPIEPPAAGILGEPPPPTPHQRTTISKPPPPTTTEGGGRIADPGGPLTVDEMGAAQAVYEGADKGQALLDSPYLSGEGVAEAAVPKTARRFRDTLSGEQHPEFRTASQMEMARAYRAGTLPPEQMARIGRYLGQIQQTYNRVTALNQAGFGQSPLDESMLNGNIRPSPDPIDRVVDHLADNEVISFEEQQWLHGRKWDETLNDGEGGWASEGLSDRKLRDRRSRFYESDPRFMENTPALLDPSIYAPPWRRQMAEARAVQDATSEQVSQINEARRQLLPDAAVFGGNLTEPTLPQTPMQLGGRHLGDKAVVPQYLPSGLAPSETVTPPRMLEGGQAGTIPGDLPTRASKIRSAEVSTGPSTAEGLAERFGADVARATRNHYYGELLDRGGKLGAAYGWDGNADIDPTNPYFTESELLDMHNQATTLERRGGTYQQHYGKLLVDEMAKKGWEPWPETGAIGQPLKMEDRRGLTRNQRGEEAFGIIPSDIHADTPWLRLGLRESAAPYMIPKVPGAVLGGIAKLNRVFKGVTLAPNVRWQIGDAVTHYLLAAFEGVSPAELRTNINRARELGGEIGALPQERVRGRLAHSGMRVGGQSEAARMLMEHIRPQSTRIDTPYATPEIGGKLQPGREPVGTQTVGKVRKMWDPTVGRMVDASYRFNQTGNNLRREAMFLAQLDRRLQRVGMTLDDPATLERLAHSSPAQDPMLYRDIRASVDRANKVMGDMDALSPFERDYMTQIFPFWGWTSTLARLTSALAIHNPSRLLFTMYLGQMVANGQTPDLPGYQGTVQGPGGFWPTAFANPFADIGGLPGLEGDNPQGGGSLLDQIGASNILRASSPALKMAGALGGIDVGQGQFLSRPPGTGRRDAYGREGLTPIAGDLGALTYQALSQVPMGRRVLNLLPRATIPLPGTDLTTGNVVRYDTGESMGFGGGTPLPTRLGSLAGLPLPFSQTRTAETQRLVGDRLATYQRGARSRARAARRRQSMTANLPRFP